MSASKVALSLGISLIALVRFAELALRGNDAVRTSNRAYFELTMTAVAMTFEQLTPPTSEESARLTQMGANYARVVAFEELVIGWLNKGELTPAKAAIALAIRDWSGFYLPCLIVWVRRNTDYYASLIPPQEQCIKLADLFDYMNGAAIAARGPEAKYCCPR
ncbi:MAG: hypothetical protein CEO22_25 [Candidatus Berkelbacteria bacterium Gr01-1014_85]|uniref:Uncharacterized protein n=1 Tax=Candidatus Berkelbacteria bacterium Gr01-1014_85 TaxID=2017150 RepID=A0A554JE88_9BACT|nr:MAG: hypothetical protein CEO22_25 [Candidatus Berkelbacteria bacterium Gr01-1014_85]